MVLTVPKKLLWEKDARGETLEVLKELKCLGSAQLALHVHLLLLPRQCGDHFAILWIRACNW
jgi:hypothetical protein